MTEYKDIHARFVTVTKITFCKVGDMAGFCGRNNINRGGLSSALNHPEVRRLQAEWIAAFCSEYGINADWVLTGRGKSMIR